MNKFWLALLAGLSIAIATGVVCGHFSQRWGPAPDLLVAGNHLKSMPKQFGTWQLVEDQEMDESVVRMLSCSGYVNRKYVDRSSGEEVTVAIVAGPAGPISVHTPEICYSSRDYTLEGNRQHVELSDAKERLHSLWSSTFHSNGAVGGRMRVYYAWLSDGSWAAADSPRFAYAGLPLLLKLQVAGSIPREESNESRDPARKFLQDLLQSGWSAQG